MCGDTGSLRDLDHIIWRMRLTVVLQLAHWKLRANDVWTVEPEKEAARAEVERRLARSTKPSVQL